VSRAFTAGEELLLDLPLAGRLTVADRRVDAVRGCVAIERGPLVYALEQQDQPGGAAPDDLALRTDGELREEQRADLFGGITVIKAAGAVLSSDGADHGHQPHPGAGSQARDAELVAIPYHLWANRGPQAMRVWIPTV
jgi:DUF1680 family protein